MHIANHRHDRVTSVSCNAKAIHIKRTCLHPCIFYRTRQSLEELKSILELVNEVKGDLSGIPVMLVGNKMDEESGTREVSEKTGQALQQMWKCKYMETSAKNGTNVTELFEELLKLETSRVLSLQPIEETGKKTGMKKIKEKCVLM